MKTNEQVEINRVRDRTIELFKSGIISDITINAEGEVETPIRMLNLDKTMCAWYVGITIEDRLVGYMQFTPELELMCSAVYSGDGLPKTWLDPNAILDLAKTKAESGDVFIEQFLSYDKNPSRIAWVVRYQDKGGKVGTIFVAGECVYKDLEGQIRPGCR